VILLKLQKNNIAFTNNLNPFIQTFIYTNSKVVVEDNHIEGHYNHVERNTWDHNNRALMNEEEDSIPFDIVSKMSYAYS
jgi:hypothetical protein